MMDQVEELTEREFEIEQLIYNGLSNAEIAEHCCIVEGTVKTHAQTIYRKRLIEGGRLKLMGQEIARLRDAIKKLEKRSPHAFQESPRYQDEVL